MNESPKSSGEIHIERLMQELDPGSERYRVLDTAKRFKSSWVELGEQLLQVNRGKLFNQWGYTSFEEYCSREIRIKKPTAEKLTLAYRYLEKEEPALLARKGELKPLPDFRSVDLLRQAREEKDFSEEEYAGLRKAIIEDERSHPTVRKQFKEIATTKQDAATHVLMRYQATLSTARRLSGLLNELQDFGSYAESLPELIAKLESFIHAAQGEEEDSGIEENN